MIYVLLLIAVRSHIFQWCFIRYNLNIIIKLLNEASPNNAQKNGILQRTFLSRDTPTEPPWVWNDEDSRNFWRRTTGRAKEHIQTNQKQCLRQNGQGIIPTGYLRQGHWVPQPKILHEEDRRFLRTWFSTQKEIGLFADTQELRCFGVGVYFYIEFFRRLCWLFLILTLIQGICIYINYQGTGLNNYSLSFSSFLIKTTIGKLYFIQATTRDRSWQQILTDSLLPTHQPWAS